MPSNVQSLTGIRGGDMAKDESKGDDKSSNLQDRLSGILGHGQEKLSGRIKDWDARKLLMLFWMPRSLSKESGKSMVQQGY